MEEVHVCLQHNASKTKAKSSTVLVLNCCSLSILNPETNEAIFTDSVPTAEVSAGHTSSLKPMKFIYSHLPKYTFKGALTIQVDATILCVSEPMEEDGMAQVPSDNIRNELHILYKEATFTDVTIKCGGREFKAHKVILVSQSPVFRKMFEVDMKEKQNSIIEISDISPIVMSDLLDYVNTGNAPHLSSLAKELLHVAIKYQLSRLLFMCEKELRKQLEVENVVEVCILATLYNTVELKAACFRFIQCHSSEVVGTTGWQHLKDNVDQHSPLLIEILEVLAN